jgi:hypothetical protein
MPVTVSTLYDIELPNYTLNVKDFFGLTKTVLGKFIVNSKPYWMWSLTTATSSKITATVENRVFYTKTTGEMWWKLTATTTIIENLSANTLPAIPICKSTDAFTLT